MTWVVQRNKKKDCITNEIIMEELQKGQTARALASEEELREKSSDYDHEGLQWIMDTGCGSDLISKVEDHKLRRSKAKCPIRFQTTNDNTKGMEVVTVNIVEIDEIVEPYVLPDTPSVLSIGRRCMREGYHFVWLAGKHSCPDIGCTRGGN